MRRQLYIYSYSFSMLGASYSCSSVLIEPLEALQNGKLQNIFWYLYDALHKPNHKQMFDTNIWNRYLSFNVLKQNRISLPRTSILFYRQPCFWPQTQICLSRFPVTGSKYAYSMLIYKLIKFCCVPQQSFPIMYKSNLLFLLTSMMQWAVDESNRKRIVWEKWSV